MKFTLNQEIEFIPESNGNKDLPDNEQIKITIKRPTYKEFSELTNIQCIVDKGNDSQMRFDTRVDYEKIIKNHVTSIKNLSIDNGKGTTDIKTGSDLLLIKGTNKSFRDLVDEIGQAVLKDNLEGEELKK